MNPSDAEEYTQALGQVVAGGWRQIALGQRLGVPQALGLSVDDWVQHRLGGYVKLGVSERRAAVQELIADGCSQRQAAAVLGVDAMTVNHDLRAVEKSTEPVLGHSERDESTVENSTPLDVITGLAADDGLRREAARVTTKAAAADATRVRREASRNAAPKANGYDYRIGDARKVLADVAENSVHLVLTDPPYGDEAEPLYQWLAEWSARVLVDGGSLICFTGQSRLDRDMRLLSAHLRYWWLLAMRHNQAQRLPGKFVMAEFKPVLWFVKGHRRGRTLVNDILRSDRRDKDGHDWGQGDGGVELLIEQLTEPDDRIVDPFAGAGKWGQIAVRMGRAWVGADVVDGGDTVVQAPPLLVPFAATPNIVDGPVSLSTTPNGTPARWFAVGKPANDAPAEFTRGETSSSSVEGRIDGP